MKKITSLYYGLAIMALTMLFACAPVTQKPISQEHQPVVTSQEKPQAEDENAGAETAAAKTSLADGQLPVRFQQPSFLIKEDENAGIGGTGDENVVIPVGADISTTTGPVALRDILKRLAALKNMNVSWASDVDQFAMVDVDIRAEDDFFEAIDNILRQKDYFHVVEGNTIVVKYRETKTFHIAMPFMASKYTSEVGGDVLGASGGSNVKGNIQLTSSGNAFDIWDNIRKNLDQILEIWVETVPAASTEQTTAAGAPLGGTAGSTPATTTSRRNVQDAKGYYTIDKPIGMITVSAPRPLMGKISSYINNLKKELYKQISIEAKIIEVTLTDGSTTGINWEGVLSAKNIHFELFGNGAGGAAASTGIIYPGANRLISAVSLENPFTLVLNAIANQGKTKVLANPKIRVMNGQPALISVGQNKKYIDSVTSTADQGVITYSVTTSSVMSGLGMSVVATIMENNDIVLSLTPVTSKLQTPIEYKNFGGSNTVGLPQVDLREMNTVVKIKSGEMLVVGGLIDNSDDVQTSKVPLLGDIPGLKKLFSSDTKTKTEKELVILLMPKIIP